MMCTANNAKKGVRRVRSVLPIVRTHATHACVSIVAPTRRTPDAANDEPDQDAEWIERCRLWRMSFSARPGPRSPTVSQTGRLNEGE